MNDSMEKQVEAAEQGRPALIEMLHQLLKDGQGQETGGRKRGRPREVEWIQICLGLLVSVLYGMSNYQQWWRRLKEEWLLGYAPIKVTDDAIIKRLKQAGTKPFEELLMRMKGVPREQATTQSGCTLAPFATEIVAIDEMSGEQMQRHLKEQRSLPAGDRRLLPGKLAGRFNLRSQQWELVQWRKDALANCKVEALSLLAGLAQGSLILADLGYFAFPWFDELTKLGYWWISRLREGTSYKIAHTFYRHEGTLDALIWLGAWRANQAGEMVRLVRFWDGQRLHCYITNVLDPHQLSIKQIAQLYARRWDIELAFLLLKKYLGLKHWWSSHPVLMEQQCLVVLIVAQLLQGLRLQMAAQARVDAFEVSLPLVVEMMPQLLMKKQEPLEWMRNYGKELGLIRAHTRLEPVVPEIAAEELVMPSKSLQQKRKPRYARYGEKVIEGRENAVESKTGAVKKRARKKGKVVEEGSKLKEKGKDKKSKRKTKSQEKGEKSEKQAVKYEKSVKEKEKKEKQNEVVSHKKIAVKSKRNKKDTNPKNIANISEKQNNKGKPTKNTDKRENMKQKISTGKEEIPLFSG